MEFAILILLIAASPIILILVFSDIMAAKEESEISNNPRKISKTLVFLIFILFTLLLIYLVIPEGNGIHMRQAFKSISYFFGFLHRI